MDIPHDSHPTTATVCIYNSVWSFVYFNKVLIDSTEPVKMTPKINLEPLEPR